MRRKSQEVLGNAKKNNEMGAIWARVGPSGPSKVGWGPDGAGWCEDGHFGNNWVGMYLTGPNGTVSMAQNMHPITFSHDAVYIHSYEIWW